MRLDNIGNIDGTFGDGQNQDPYPQPDDKFEPELFIIDYLETKYNLSNYDAHFTLSKLVAAGVVLADLVQDLLTDCPYAIAKVEDYIL